MNLTPDTDRDRQNASISRTFEELKLSGRLPTPTGVGLAILCLTQGEEASTDEIARVIQGDPALTGRVLRVANSLRPEGGPRPGPIASLSDAVRALGAHSVCHVALGFSLLSDNRTGVCACFDYDDYWLRSLARAVAARSLAERLGTGDPSELFTLGLLAEIGRLALASVHPEAYADLIQLLREHGDLDELELEVGRFGIHHGEVSEALLWDWGLPSRHCEAVGRFERFGAGVTVLDPEVRELARLLYTAQRVAECCAAPEARRLELAAGFEDLGADLGLGREELDALCEAVASEWRDWSAQFGLAAAPVPAPSAHDRAGERERPAREEPACPPALSEPLRVLAVDADPLSRRLLVRHLEGAGHRVLTAAGGREALALALENNPQVVISDRQMAEMGGLDLCHALRRYESGRGMYFVLLTGDGDEDGVVEAFEAGVDDYVQKPFRPKVLLARVRGARRVVALQEQVERDKKTQREQVARMAVLTRQLRAASMTDVLTDMPNRRYAMKRLEEEWARCSRSGHPLSLVLLDVDHFKRVNDVHGHDVGDVVLCRTARLLEQTTREGDVVARIGGEEFLVICPNTDLDGARHCGERVRAAVESHRIDEPEFRGGITLSAGVATRSADCPSIDALLKAAGEAVEAAKREGRNQVTVAGDTPRRRSA